MDELNLYEPRTMMQAIKKKPPVRTFLRDTYFRQRKTFITETFDVDFKRGARELAPFINPIIGGRVVKNHGYTTKNYKSALVGPKVVTDAKRLMARLPGETIYSGKTPERRGVELLHEDLDRLDEMVARREEWMCAKALFTGEIPIIGEDVQELIDFQFTNYEELTGAAKWDTTTADIYGDFERWIDTVAKNGYTTVNSVIMSSDVAQAIINNEKFQKLLDIRHYELAVINPRDNHNGIRYVGSVGGLGLDLYVYNEWYLDDSLLNQGGAATERPLVPAGTLAMLNTNASYSMYYGAITYIPREGESFITVEGTRVPKSWVAHDPDRRFLQLMARPMPIPHEVDSWFVAKVV